MPKLNLAFFASHGGSNMQAIIDACKEGRLDAIPRVVISNNSNAFALERAKKEGIPYYHISSVTHPNPEEFTKAILDILEKHQVDTIVLAGYMKLLPAEVIKKYHNRILNIHPALLPKFGGKGMYGINVHKAVLEAGEKITGVTVHLVNEEYDKGRILAQVEVPVLENDTPETLAERVLQYEHKLYPETLQKIASGEIVL